MSEEMARRQVPCKRFSGFAKDEEISAQVEVLLRKLEDKEGCSSSVVASPAAQS